LGTITHVTLGPTNGDAEFTASGVPCTSVRIGSQIGTGTPVTIYQNPAIFGSGDPTRGEPACTGRLVTSQYGKRCTFHDIPWEIKRAGNETFYDGICDDAWSHFWSQQGWLDYQTGVILTPEGEGWEGMIDGVDLDDDDLVALLSQTDANQTHWEKAKSEVYVPSSGHAFEIHFVRHIPTDTVNFDVDWKVRFLETFDP
jgi:hypothetical protein